MKMLVIPTSGAPYTIEGGDSTYETLKETIGGWLEAVTLNDGSMYFDEEGKLKELEPNQVATLLALVDGSIQKSDYIAGTAVCLGPVDDEGEDTPVDPVLVDAVMAIHRSVS